MNHSGWRSGNSAARLFLAICSLWSVPATAWSQTAADRHGQDFTAAPGRSGTLLAQIQSPESKAKKAAQFVAPSPENASTPWQIVVSDVADQKSSGRLTGLSKSELQWQSENSDRVTPLPLSRVKSITRAAVPFLPAVSAPVIFLTGQGWVRARPTALNESAMTGEWATLTGLAPWSIPLESVRGAILVDASSSARQVTNWRRLLDEPRTADVVFLRNGDRTSGEFKSLADGTLSLQAEQSTSKISLAGIEMLASNSELLSVPAATDTSVVVCLTDGSRLPCRGVRLDGDRLRMETLAGGELTVPWMAVQSLWPVGGDLIYLSDLKPERYQHQPFVGLDWPIRLDRGLLGGELRLGRDACVKGVAMHATSEATWSIPAGWKYFSARIGLADTAQGQGSVLFEVRLDNRSLFRSAELTGQNTAVQVGPISLETAKQITLRVEHASRGDILDHAVWSEARLHR